jgi:hypothetical protein
MNQALQLALLCGSCDCGDCYDCNDKSHLFIPCEACGEDKYDECECYDTYLMAYI